MKKNCDYEYCPGRRQDARLLLIWSPKYLFLHKQCLSGAKLKAKERGEPLGFRLGI